MDKKFICRTEHKSLQVWGCARPDYTGGPPILVDMYSGDSVEQYQRALDDVKFWHSLGERATLAHYGWKIQDE